MTKCLSNVEQSTWILPFLFERLKYDANYFVELRKRWLVFLELKLSVENYV